MPGFGSGIFKFDYNEDVYPLNLMVYREVEYFLNSNATAAHCLSTLERFIVRSLKIRGASHLFDVYITKYYIPFFRNLLEVVLIMGWCPYHFVKISTNVANRKKKETIVVPAIFPLDNAKFEMVVDKKKHTYTMRALSNDGMDEIKNIHYVFMHDKFRFANRYLMHSPLIGLVGEFRYLESIKKFTIQAEFVRSHPSIYLESAESSQTQLGSARGADAFSNPNVSSNGLPTDPLRSIRRMHDAGATPVETKAKCLNEASKSMLENIRFHAQQMQELVSNQNQNYFNKGLNYLPMHTNSLFIVPPGMKLASRPDMPQSRVDQTILEANLASQVFIALGVPESIFGPKSGSFLKRFAEASGSNGRAKNNTETSIMQINAFEATLDRFRDLFTDTMVDIYWIIFQKHISTRRIEFQSPHLYKEFLKAVMASFHKDDNSDTQGDMQKKTRQRRKRDSLEEEEEEEEEEEDGDLADNKTPERKRASKRPRK